MDALLQFAEWVDLYYYAALVLLVLVGLACFRHKRIFLAALMLSAGLSFLAKEFYAVERPCAGEAWCPDSYGFPSSHSAVIAVFAAASVGSASCIVMLPLALLVAASRVILGVHSITQALAGLVFGAACYYFVHALAHSFKDRKIVKKYRLLE
ncbi:MAG: phosphatase PAP2 family protein [Candidatus Micrarchaeia archaeon]